MTAGLCYVMYMDPIYNDVILSASKKFSYVWILIKWGINHAIKLIKWLLIQYYNTSCQPYRVNALYEDVNRRTIETSQCTHIFKVSHCLKGSQCTLKVTIAGYGQCHP